MIHKIRLLPHLESVNAELIRSQFEAFSRQIPLLYFILVTNSAAVAYTHRHAAPIWLWLYLPAAMGAFCAWRVSVWLRRGDVTLSVEEIVKRMRVTIQVLVPLGAAFTFWGLALYPYGNAYQQGHVAFYMSITVIGCIFCLMHMRTAALMLTAIVIVPFTLFFSATGNPVFVAIAVNVLLVSFAMIWMLVTYYRDFARLIESQKALLAKQEETAALSDENHRLANIDSLTNLPNRRSFFAEVDALLSRGGDEPQGFAVGILDLDGFKQVNDLYGHGFGDRVLEQTGKRLASLASDTVIVARLGGDEFGVLVMDTHLEDELIDFGAQLCRLLQGPIVQPQATARLSASLGFAAYPQAGDKSEQLLERADYALYFAKERQRGGTVIFSHDHETEIRRIATVEQALRRANLEHEMSLAFQPIVDIAAGRVIAFEALARWNSPALGKVTPSVFIPIAERCGVIHAVTEVLLSKALAFARACPDDVRLSFNLSAVDLASETALARIVELTRTSGVAAKRIDFEVTETAIINDFDRAQRALIALKSLGVNISLDDFGTGYSSLSRLHLLPLDKIKIDRSFVDDIDGRPRGRDIVKSIRDLAANLGMDCVVEGVENATQLDILRALGCTLIQGFVFSEPLTADAARAYLAGCELSA